VISISSFLALRLFFGLNANSSMNLSAKSLINRIVVGTVLLSAGAIIGIYIGMKKDQNWASLYNGKDLSDWSVESFDADSRKAYWKSEDGMIVCDSMGDKDHDSIWLKHALEIEDFELKLKFRAFRESPGNSGVQVRSRWVARSDLPKGAWMHGPQIDIHPPLPWRTGLIYDETPETKRWISQSMPSSKIDAADGPEEWVFNYADSPNAWNNLIIRCEGTRITTTLNGMMVTDFEGEGLLNDEAHKTHRVGMRGFIALQLHAKDELKMHFKDIFIREL
jgi:hypothetical protein